MDVIKSRWVSARPIEKVIVHPRVLLHVEDHFERIVWKEDERVVGVLLGSSFEGTVEISNSFAVPFEEDVEDVSIWFHKPSYLEEMLSLFRRINDTEHVVGWYTTGRKLRKNDLDIHRLFFDYVTNPVLVITEVPPREFSIPAKAYCTVDGVKETATEKGQKALVHVPSEIVADELEEMGFEHLFRDVRGTTFNNSTLATEVSRMYVALNRLSEQLANIYTYLEYVEEETFPLNQEILYHVQDVFNRLPDLKNSELIKALTECLLQASIVSTPTPRVNRNATATLLLNYKWPTLLKTMPHHFTIVQQKSSTSLYGGKILTRRSIHCQMLTSKDLKGTPASVTLNMCCWT